MLAESLNFVFAPRTMRQAGSCTSFYNTDISNPCVMLVVLQAVDKLEGHLSDLDELDAEVGHDEMVSADPEALKAAIKENTVSNLILRLTYNPSV
jgi:hypothetical protein